MTEKKHNRIIYIIALSLGGLCINILGSYISGRLGLPVYLDCFGTVLVSALAGYLPGILTGFFANLIASAFDPNMLYYLSCNMLIAVIVAFFAKRGFFDEIQKAIAVVVTLVLTAGVLSSVMEWAINAMEKAEAAAYAVNALALDSTTEGFAEHLLNDLGVEFFDKAFAVIFTFIIYNLLSEKTRKLFSYSAYDRICPDEDMHFKTEKNIGLKGSVRLKIVAIFMAGLFLVAAIGAGVSTHLYKSATINEHIRMANGITQLITENLDPERIDDYLANGENAEGYTEVEDRLYELKNAYPDVEYVYVYKILPDGCHVVFDLDSNGIAGDEPGAVVPFDESFNRYKDMILAGGEIEPVVSDDSYGHLLTVYKPLYNTRRQCVCYAGVDFSIPTLSIFGSRFVVRLISILMGFFIVILLVAVTFINGNIIAPINAMSYVTRTFAYDSEEAREHNVESIRSLSIHTGDEIENLYQSFLKNTEDSMEYVKNLRKARILVEDMKVHVREMDEIAYKDALTGLGNKAAYDLYSGELDETIKKDPADVPPFAVIMIDVNYLKKVNDNYGHECGNIYLGNCAEMIKRIFGEEVSYRFGGDEFVVLLMGEIADRSGKLVSNFKKEMVALSGDPSLDPWEKVSAAVGIAQYDPGVDKNVDDVFKRSDEEMYKDKVAMKAERRD